MKAALPEASAELSSHSCVGADAMSPKTPSHETHIPSTFVFPPTMSSQMSAVVKMRELTIEHEPATPAPSEEKTAVVSESSLGRSHVSLLLVRMSDQQKTSVTEGTRNPR